MLLDLARRAGVHFEAHYNNTTCDPPELVRFIRESYPEISIDMPRKSIWQLIPERGFPTRVVRWCCAELKERGGKGRIVLTGIRDEESPRRKKRRIVEHCLRSASKTYVHPIKFWKTRQVWEYIREREIEYCSLYDEGFSRIGCIICPFDSNVQRSMNRWPKVWNVARWSFEKLYQRSKLHQEKWASAQAMFEWWVDREASYPKTDNSLSLFP